MAVDKKQNATLYGEDANVESILDIKLTKRPAPFDRLVKVPPVKRIPGCGASLGVVHSGVWCISAHRCACIRLSACEAARSRSCWSQWHLRAAAAPLSAAGFGPTNSQP